MEIRELRKKTGMSQSEFAEHIGIPLSTLRSWEHGRRTPPEYVMGLLEFRIEAEKKDCMSSDRNKFRRSEYL